MFNIDLTTPLVIQVARRRATATTPKGVTRWNVQTTTGHDGNSVGVRFSPAAPPPRSPWRPRRSSGAGTTTARATRHRAAVRLLAKAQAPLLGSLPAAAPSPSATPTSHTLIRTA